MRNQGQGTLTYLGAGKWRLRVNLGVDSRGQRRRASRTIQLAGRHTRLQAEAALQRFIAEAGPADTTDRPLADLLNDWHQRGVQRSQWQHRTAVEHRACIDNILTPRLGHLPLSQVTPRALDEFFDTLTERYRPASIRRFRSVLNGALNQAVRWGELDRNPLDLAAPIRGAAARRDAATGEQIGRLLAACHTPWLHTAVVTLALTGLRRGELCAAVWNNLDLDKRTLTVDASAYIGEDGATHIKTTKTDRVRTVALSHRAAETLGQWNTTRTENAEREGYLLPGDAYIFGVGPAGMLPANPDVLSHQFKQAAKQAGVRLSPHMLRHFAATEMLGAGASVVDVARQLGHAQPSTTLNIYAHPALGRQAAAANTLDKIFD